MCDAPLVISIDLLVCNLSLHCHCYSIIKCVMVQYDEINEIIIETCFIWEVNSRANTESTSRVFTVFVSSIEFDSL
jgi:hypothetical protein